MDGVREKIKQVRLRDFTLVALCAIIVYLFRAHESFQLQPVWRKMLKSEHFGNGAYPTYEEALPSPIITDLESDGINEIVLITNDLRLSLLAIPDRQSNDGDDHNNAEKKFDTRVLPHVVIKHSRDLPHNASSDQRLDWPVAMGTGYLVPYQSLVQVRKQVIVIVLDDWSVLCYDHDLTLLWTRQLLDVGGIRDTYRVKSMSVLITAVPLQKGDTGVVIVGGSFSHRAHQANRARSGEHGHDKHSTEEEFYTHFSTFALSGQDGSTRWQHLPGDFGEQKHEEQTEEAFHWKLKLKVGNHHTGESPSIHFQDDLHKQLPHSWKRLKDTGITLANIRKQSIGPKPDQPAEAPVTETVIGALGGEHLRGYAYGGLRPHSHHEHIQNPNSVIIHNHNGLEVLKLQTGQPITKLPLTEGDGVYLDINGDKIVEKVKFWLVDDRTKERTCHVEVQSMMGRIKKQVFKTSVCDSWRFLGAWTAAEREDTVKHLSPLVIKSVAQKRSIFQHILGDHLVPTSKSWDIIVATSSGKLTSLAASGHIQWQVDTGASWLVQAESAHSGAYEDITHKFYSSFQPSFQDLSLQVYGKKDALVLVGWQSLVLVDLKQGRLLGQHTLPCHPTDQLVIGDFDNNGWNDIILSCPLGYIGFSIHKEVNHLYTALYGVGVFLGILLLTWCLISDTDHTLDDME